MNFYKCCLALTQIAFTQITLLVERQDGVLVQTCPYTKKSTLSGADGIFILKISILDNI